MSAPEVGDRVRVIAGQWRGREGVVTEVEDQPLNWLWVGLCGTDSTFERVFRPAEVEKVAPTPTDGHRGDETGADLLADPDDANGPRRGEKR